MMGPSLFLCLLWMQSTLDQFVSQHDDAISEAKQRIHSTSKSFWANYEKVLACSIKGECKQARYSGQGLKQFFNIKKRFLYN